MTFARIITMLSLYNKRHGTDFYFAVKPSERDSGIGYYWVVSPIPSETVDVHGVFWYDKMEVDCESMIRELEAFFSTPFTPCYNRKAD